MANKEGVIKTDVDKLLKVLRDRKVMTMVDLSKEMNLPFKTMESLTGLLEEEKMVHITYKFTTPYVHYGPPEAKGEEAAKEKTEGEKALFAMEQEELENGKAEEKVEITKKEKSKIKKKGKEEVSEHAEKADAKISDKEKPAVEEGKPEEKLKGKTEKGEKATTTKRAPAEKAPSKKRTAQPTATDQVLKIIKSSKKGVDTATLMTKTGFNQKKVRNILQRTYKQGKIKRLEKGIYVGMT